jgi:hypothetical protein
MGQHPAERALHWQTGRMRGTSQPDGLGGFRSNAREAAIRDESPAMSCGTNPNGSGFWTGSPPQMVELAARAYPIINQLILQPSLLLRQHRPPAGPFLTANPLSHQGTVKEQGDSGAAREPRKSHPAWAPQRNDIACTE